MALANANPGLPREASRLRVSSSSVATASSPGIEPSQSIACSRIEVDGSFRATLMSVLVAAGSFLPASTKSAVRRSGTEQSSFRAKVRVATLRAVSGSLWRSAFSASLRTACSS